MKDELLLSLGADPAARKEFELDRNWTSYIYNQNMPTGETPIILIERGPKNIAEVKRRVRALDSCIVFFEEKSMLYFKIHDESGITTLENESEYQKIISMARSQGLTGAKDGFEMMIAVQKVIDVMPNATGDFVNHGLFSTHYLRSRIFGDSRQDADLPIKDHLGDTRRLLEGLGWDISNPGLYHGGRVSITITDQDDFNIRHGDGVAPSYDAVATLRRCEWAILTNGTKWRLYSSKVSASSTNYFEITLDPERDAVTKYLIMLFSFGSFQEIDGKVDVDVFFDEGKHYSTGLEEDIASKIMSPDGLFIDLIKGILGHDMKKRFSTEDLDSAKQSALKILYRVWFVAYAESRNLLPVKSKKYRPISLLTVRSRLDSYENNPDGDDCWTRLKDLFGGIRKGSKKHNLPQYNGDLFRTDPEIDNTSIKNRFIASALRGLLEQDGETIDYTNLGVRHLGNIFETLMEFSPRQADRNLMLVEDKKGVREVETDKEATYSYKENDLYLASKLGVTMRKTTASFYTPDEIVKFLVKRGLDPIFEERERLILSDIAKYSKSGSEEDKKACMDRILDLQVLDPAMGSGHFLVEALNQITVWATEMIKRYPGHPLLADIEADQGTVLREQEKRGISIDETMLTNDVLLKRKIMKRCIFGVDLNPMAVDLAKLSLWLDSFAIGVPLTYMDHHIKCGDSTIGMFLDDIKNRESGTIDDWMPGEESGRSIASVICSSDITAEQVRASEDAYHRHVKSLEPTKRILDALTASRINPKLLPKKGKEEFIHKFGASKIPRDLKSTLDMVNDLRQKHRFFHWELEMMDAFTTGSRGYDLVLGNPPWDKVKPSTDEFFTPYYPPFRSLIKFDKNKEVERICEDKKTATTWEKYKQLFAEKMAFYSAETKLQGSGDRDLWQLVMERAFDLFGEGGGISILVPSQLLSNNGSTEMRRQMLERDIRSLYVFENRKKIFDIHSSYRFALLTFRNREGPDEFDAGFYLHHLSTLKGSNMELEKLCKVSKHAIRKVSPKDYIIPETSGDKLNLLNKIMFGNRQLGDGINDIWTVELSSGFHQSKDADIIRKNKPGGWPILQGKNIHQFIYNYAADELTADMHKGLERENKKKKFHNKSKEIHNSYRLAFRDIAGSTNIRTVLASITPPQTFHTGSIYTMLLKQNNQIILNIDYDRKISYLCGILNSMTFDFVARSKIQMHVATIMSTLPIPKKNKFDDQITELAAKLSVGTSEFEGFAESLRIPNAKLTPRRRIEAAAKLDALVAHSYGLALDEYKLITESFPSFKKDPTLYDREDITWDSNNLKGFYGEMASLALKYFEDMGGK